MPRARRHVEIWSDIQAASGSRLAVIPDVLSARDTLRLTGDHQLDLELPIRSSAYSSIRARRVLRVTYEDETFDEWRIATPEEVRSENGDLRAKITAWPIRHDLGRSILSRTEADGSVWYEFEALQLTPTQHFNTFIGPALTAHGFTHFALGTVDTATPTLVDMVYSSDSALSALIRLAEAAQLELNVRRNGTTQYLIDLVTAVGSSAVTKMVLLKRDLQGITRRFDTSEQATRIVPRGAVEDGFHANMAEARWRVVAVTGNDIELEDPEGGEDPIAFDDQFNGMFLLKTNGTLTQINDTVLSTQVVAVGTPSNITAGDLVKIRADSAGTRLTYLEDPANKATYGLFPRVLDRPEIPSAVNLVSNPALKDWGGGEPTGWSAVSTPTLTETTTATRWRTAGKSARVETNADGEGIECDAFTIAASTQKRFFSGYVSLYLISGRVRVEFVTNTGLVIPNGTTDGKAFTSEINNWIELGIAGIDLQALGATTLKMRVVQDGSGTAEWFLDCGQVTQTPGHLPFFVGAGPNKLWAEANRKLRTNAAPLVQIGISLIDLHRANPVRFPASIGEELVLGGTVRVKDSVLGIDVTTRFQEIRRDLLEHGVASVQVTNRVRDIADRLAAIARNPKEPRDPIAPLANQLQVRITRVSETDDDITIRVAVIGASAGLLGLGTLTVTVAYDAGGLTVSPASGQTLTATASFATTGTVDFTITRPAQGQKPSRVTFTATGTGHLDGTDGVDVYPKGFRFRCRAKTSSLQSIANNTNTAVQWDGADDYDVGGLHDPSTNNTRITVPTGGGVGVWVLAAALSFSGSSGAGNRRAFGIRKNGAAPDLAIAQIPPCQGGDLTGMTIVAYDNEPAVGDYYEAFVFQDSGAALNHVGGFFSATHLF